MNDIIIGSICSLCAMIKDPISGIRKKHSFIGAASTLFVAGTTAVSLIRKAKSK